MTLPIDTTLDLQSVNKIVNVPAPTDPGDAVPKSYADAIAQGIIYKEAVQGVATTDIGVNAPGAIGTVADGERVLLTGQTDATQDGIWDYNGAASPLTRPSDFLSGSVVLPGAAVLDESANLTWVLINTANVEVDTTAENWTKAASAGSLTFDAPLTQSGDTVSLNNGNPLPIADGGTGAATASGARAALSATGKYVTQLGDNSTTSFPVEHNLGTSAVAVQVFDMATGALELASVTVNDVNSVTVAFGNAPTASGGTIGSGTGKQVVVIG